MDLHDVLLASKTAGKSSGNIDLSGYYTKEQTDGLIEGLSAEIRSEKALNLSTIGYQRKNLLKNTATSKTVTGVTFTVNDDGSVTANGTNTSNSLLYFTVGTIASVSGQKYIISRRPNGAVNNSFYYQIGATVFQTNTESEYLPTSDAVRTLLLVIKSGTTLENVTFFPMIRYADITDDTYEPYRPSVSEYIESRIVTLDSMADFEALTDKTAEFYFIKEA